jgi:hypothetical protein
MSRRLLATPSSNDLLGFSLFKLFHVSGLDISVLDILILNRWKKGYEWGIRIANLCYCAIWHFTLNPYLYHEHLLHHNVEMGRN